MNVFNKAYESVKESIFKRDSENVDVFEKIIGYEWEHFGAIEGDSAKRIEWEDPNIYEILYQTDPDTPEDKENEFIKHSHKEKELGRVVLGKIHIETSKESYFVNEGEHYVIDSLKSHVVTFYGHTKLSLLFHPSPKNGNWKAQFL